MSISNTLKKAINFILTGSMSIVFAACYGSEMELRNPKALKIKDPNDNPIPGLKVSLTENQTVISELFSDDAGFVEFQFPQDENIDYVVKIEDIDGSDNLGEFQTKEISLNTESYIEINLQKKN